MKKERIVAFWRQSPDCEQSIVKRTAQIHAARRKVVKHMREFRALIEAQAAQIACVIVDGLTPEEVDAALRAFAEIKRASKAQFN